MAICPCRRFDSAAYYFQNRRRHYSADRPRYRRRVDPPCPSLLLAHPDLPTDLFITTLFLLPSTLLLCLILFHALFHAPRQGGPRGQELYYDGQPHAIRAPLKR